MTTKPAMMKLILNSLLALSLFATSALAQTPIGPSGGAAEAAVPSLSYWRRSSLCIRLSTRSVWVRQQLQLRRARARPKRLVDERGRPVAEPFHAL